MWKYLEDIFKSDFYTNYFGLNNGFISHIDTSNYHHYLVNTISISDGLPVDQSSVLRPLFLTEQTEQVFSTLNNSFTSQQPVTGQHVTTVRLGIGELVRIIYDFHARYCRLRDPVANNLFLNRVPSMLEIYSHARRLNLRPLNPSELFFTLSQYITSLNNPEVVRRFFPNSTRPIIFASEGIWYNGDYYLFGCHSFNQDDSTENFTLQVYPTFALPVDLNTPLVFALNTTPPWLRRVA